MYEIKQRRVLSQILTCFIFLVLLSKYYGFVKKNHPSKKNVIWRKNQIALIEMTLETYRVHLGSCSSMRNVRISQQSMMVKNVLEILAKKIRCFTIACRCPLSDKCCRREYFFSNQWNIYWESQVSIVFLVIFLLPSKYERQEMFL